MITSFRLKRNGSNQVDVSYTQTRFCNITVILQLYYSYIGGCLVAQNTVAEIWSNAW